VNLSHWVRLPEVDKLRRRRFDPVIANAGQAAGRPADAQPTGVQNLLASWKAMLICQQRNPIGSDC
jgi:hypothetical protein